MTSENFFRWWSLEGEARIMGFVMEQEQVHAILPADSIKALAAFAFDSALYAVLHGEIKPADLAGVFSMPHPGIERKSKPFNPPTGALPIGDRS